MNGSLEFRSALFKVLLFLTSILCVGSAGAQDFTGPCVAVLCLAGKMEGGEGGPGCVAAEQIYFSIRVFDPYYDPAATSAARMLYLQGCATEHLGQKEAVNAVYGTWFSGP
ncbi:hypothetical protein EA658_14045 [Pseudoxanthomonas winnipegensis]|jgi:hypothetical protein|uniref:Uncharacterized protein n=1 Tax=Pseudoxanthomonas winnipegensis TaxID=2480810 RepID=A0ABY1WBA0_9GAMM|nr:hypothetical protein [Pseudoxanthomonas winnipegensis]TAA10829.1 hypothetical protein EA659_05455 [Pseudoxanthomonas winnipegensis]TAA18256.1 hypothetical protein EA658_14045 [Pseudoxanthomonas winnipegensis]TAH74370.1 hypothetical protein EA657_02705 [Pseudoxanthomonas winnipegensis]